MKLPSDLRVTPLEHDIKLEIYERNIEDGDYPVIHFKFGVTSGEATFSPDEAIKISKWFEKLALAIK